MAEYARTDQLAAENFGVSRQTFSEWSRNSDFPRKSKRGWNLGTLDKWCKTNSKGPYRKRAAGSDSPFIDGNGTTITFTEANTRKTIEQAENERIKKERQLVEQAQELGQVVLIDDVRDIYLQTVATISAVHDSLSDAVDRAMPEQPPSVEAWPEIRARVMALCVKLGTDAAAAMQELI